PELARVFVGYVGCPGRGRRPLLVGPLLEEGEHLDAFRRIAVHLREVVGGDFATRAVQETRYPAAATLIVRERILLLLGGDELVGDLAILLPGLGVGKISGRRDANALQRILAVEQCRGIGRVRQPPDPTLRDAA